MAEKKHGISFVIKGNALKRKSDQTKEDILKLENQMLIYRELLTGPEAFCLV